jgi:hypothetical protein
VQTHGFRSDQLLRVNLVVSRLVEVTADGEKLQLDDGIAAGDSPTYAIDVANRGTVADAYAITLSDVGSGWTRTFLTAGGGDTATTRLLAPGGNQTYYLTVTPPAGSAGRGARLVTIVQAVSLSDHTVQAAVRVTTSISVNRAFSVHVRDPVRNVAPGGNTTFLVEVRNDSDALQELNVQVLSAKPAGWGDATVTWVEKRKPIPNNGNVTMDIQGNLTLAIVRAVPKGAAPLSSASDLLRLRDNLDRQATGSDTRLRVIAARVAGFTATVPPVPTALPGQHVALGLALRSTSNVNQVLNVTARLPPAGGPWSLLDAAGRPPPWTVQLAPARQSTLALTLHVPPNAPPSAAALNNLTIVVTGPGAAVQTVPVVLSVPSNLAVSVEAATLVLGAGHPADADAILRNQGNLATRVTLAWVGLPPGWDIGATEVELPVNATLRVPLLVDVPSAAVPGRTAVTLEAHEAGSGLLLGSAPWSLVVGGPRLVFSPLDAVTAAGRTVYRFQVANEGTDPAFNVTLHLLAADNHEVDQYSFQEILAGRTSVASVVASTAQAGAYVVLTSDRDPLGTVQALNTPAARASPAAWLLVPVALTLAALLRRRAA